MVKTPVDTYYKQKRHWGKKHPELAKKMKGKNIRWANQCHCSDTHPTSHLFLKLAKSNFSKY